MKLNGALLALPLAASASLLESRQFSSARQVGAQKLTPVTKPNARRTVYKFGYYSLPGAGAPAGGKGKGRMGGMGGMGGHDSTLGGKSYILNINKLCNTDAPCTVYTGKVGVEFADGTPADISKGVYIHHVLTTDTKKQTTGFLSGCNSPGTKAMSISSLGRGTGFVGVGEDSGDSPVMYTQRDGKLNAGYFVDRDNTFTAQVELVNYNKETKNVSITYDLEWAPGKVGVNTKGMLISVTQCMGTRIKMTQNGPANTPSGRFSFLEDGTLIGARGHLHDGGSHVDLILNGKKVCTSQAGYGGGDDKTASVNGKEWAVLSSMSYCDGPYPVKKGDTLAMNVVYDLKKHPLRKGASGAEATGVMGMLSLAFAPNR